MREKAGKKISSTGQADSTLPPFVFYKGFWEDWKEFPKRDRIAIGQFLEVLQEKYDDPEHQKNWEQSGKYWATLLPEIGYRVFWLVVYPKRTVPTIIDPRAEEIHILIVEPIAKEDR